MKTKLEELLEGKGYKVVDETPPFKIYEKHNKRIVYHTSSGKIWGKFILNTSERRYEDGIWKKERTSEKNRS